MSALQSSGLSLTEIKPSLHPKFSPNLWRFLRKNRSQSDYGRVLRDKDGTLWIGWIDEDTFLIGTRVMQALCEGGRCKTAAWTLNSIGKLVEVEDFWTRYVTVGRCAIDPDHQHHFTSNEPRFIGDGDHRECTWCGHKQTLRRWTEKVARSLWEDDQ